jgi:2-hydroxy-3-keto-5-methylthiopentenyl-1-phosphate phosphatase
MLKLFVDFDNTITIGDIGDALFSCFGGKQCLEIDVHYRSGILSAKECIGRKCEACGEVDRVGLDDFVDSQEIDPTFPGFVNFCRERNLDLTIVSDGIDFYVRRILNRFGIFGIPVFSNEVRFENSDKSSRVRFIPRFPHDDEECDRCACCKRNIMVASSGEEDILVYVGDGFSDRCPVQHADIVFARQELQAFCQERNISYYEFRSFLDVQHRLEQLLNQKRIRKRQSAEVNRQALFTAG